MKVTQCGNIEVRLSDHELTYSTRKISNMKVNRYDDFQESQKQNYSTESFTQKLRPSDLCAQITPVQTMFLLLSIS